jgi:hypothetical protein
MYVSITIFDDYTLWCKPSLPRRKIGKLRRKVGNKLDLDTYLSISFLQCWNNSSAS